MGEGRAQNIIEFAEKLMKSLNHLHVCKHLSLHFTPINNYFCKSKSHSQNKTVTMKLFYFGLLGKTSEKKTVNIMKTALKEGGCLNEKKPK